MIEALIAGESKPDVLAALAHRFPLHLHLQQIDTLTVAIGEIDQEVDATVEPFCAAVAILTLQLRFKIWTTERWK